MDELEIAQTVFESIVAEAGRVRLRPIAAKLSYGTMSAVNREALLEAFASLCKGTICSDTALHISEIPVRIRCHACGAESDYEVMSPHCAKCMAQDFEFLPEAPMLLEEIEFKEA